MLHQLLLSIIMITVAIIIIKNNNEKNKINDSSTNNKCFTVESVAALAVSVLLQVILPLASVKQLN